MYKRRRVDSFSEDCSMEVEVFKNEITDNSEEDDIPPRLCSLLKEIVRSGPAELVERNLNPLGVTPLGDHTKKITGYEVAELDRFTTEADSRLKQGFVAKISTISEQMRFLRQQLVNVLEHAQESLELNHVPCNFTKIPGTVYHLYLRTSGQNYFSMLSPEEWNNSPPHHYCGSYQYGHDFTWKKVA